MSCVEWTKATTTAGYGVKRIKGKIRYVHRLVAEQKYGDITGKVVRHTCDNPKCINPDHLLIGTQKDNAKDASLRNRIYKGGPKAPYRGGSKPMYTQEEYKVILDEYKQGATVKQICDKYNMSTAQLMRIRKKDLY